MARRAAVCLAVVALLAHLGACVRGAAVLVPPMGPDVRTENDVFNTNFGVRHTAVRPASLKKGSATQYCFELTTAPQYGGAACDPANSSCCTTGAASKSVEIAELQIFTSNECLAGKEARRSFKQFEWTLGGKKVGARVDAAVSGVRLRKTWSEGAELCVAIPSGTSNPCNSIAKMCGGSNCLAAAVTTKFVQAGSFSQKKSACKIAASVPIACASGTGSFDGGYTCQDCPKGWYQSANATAAAAAGAPPLASCTQCPAGLTTLGARSSSCVADGSLGTTAFVKLTGVPYNAVAMEAPLLSAAARAMALAAAAPFPASNVKIVPAASGRRRRSDRRRRRGRRLRLRRLLDGGEDDSAGSGTEGRDPTGGASGDDASTAAPSGDTTLVSDYAFLPPAVRQSRASAVAQTVVRLAFSPTGAVSGTQLAALLVPGAPFWLYLSSVLPTESFPIKSAVCPASSSGTCQLSAAGYSVRPHSECRQVAPAANATVYAQPCANSAVLGVVLACSRVEVIPSSGTRGASCPSDPSTYVEVIFGGTRGWAALTAAGGPGGERRLVACPAAGCPGGAPDVNTCRKVTSPEPLSLMSEPCATQGASINGGPPNAVLATLAPGASFVYDNTDSKQRSRCGTDVASDPPGKQICWIFVSVPGGKSGWLPGIRGTFENAFCELTRPQDGQLLAGFGVGCPYSCKPGYGGPNCDMCIPGHGGSKCVLCDAGTFSRGGNPSSTKPQCTACPRGSTPGNGSTTAGACTVAGPVRCFGGNGYGQSNVAPDLGNVSAVFGGDRHSCALTTSGYVRCWGDNSDGQSTPPADLGRCVAIAVGGVHTCAITTAGAVRCFGGNQYQQTAVPPDLGSAASITAGGYHTCAVTAAGALRCWGANGADQSSVPADLGNSSIVVSAGGFHTCALLSNFSASGNVVRCFGLASDGQIAVPSDLTNPVAVSAGFSHTCAVTSSGGVRCWGSNRSGQASPPPGLANVAAVSAGDAHTCALLAGGVARCFGRTDSGQTVVPTGLPGPVTAVSAGFGTHTCIRTA